jgi:hypothetical protein
MVKKSDGRQRHSGPTGGEICVVGGSHGPNIFQGVVVLVAEVAIISQVIGGMVGRMGFLKPRVVDSGALGVVGGFEKTTSARWRNSTLVGGDEAWGNSIHDGVYEKM